MSLECEYELTITGSSVKQVLAFIRFDSYGIPNLSGIACEISTHAEVTESNSIAPVPKETPNEGWVKWLFHNWGTDRSATMVMAASAC